MAEPGGGAIPKPEQFYLFKPKGRHRPFCLNQICVVLYGLRVNCIPARTDYLNSSSLPRLTFFLVQSVEALTVSI